MRSLIEKKEFSRALEQRTKDYAVMLIKLMRHLPNSD